LAGPRQTQHVPLTDISVLSCSYFESKFTSCGCRSVERLFVLVLKTSRCCPKRFRFLQNAPRLNQVGETGLAGARWRIHPSGLAFHVVLGGGPVRSAWRVPGFACWGPEEQNLHLERERSPNSTRQFGGPNNIKETKLALVPAHKSGRQSAGHPPTQGHSGPKRVSYFVSNSC
jgi:hypothetical protein